MYGSNGIGRLGAGERLLEGLASRPHFGFGAELGNLLAGGALPAGGSFASASREAMTAAATSGATDAGSSAATVAGTSAASDAGTTVSAITSQNVPSLIETKPPVTSGGNGTSGLGQHGGWASSVLSALRGLSDTARIGGGAAAIVPDVTPSGPVPSSVNAGEAKAGLSGGYVKIWNGMTAWQDQYGISFGQTYDIYQSGGAKASGQTPWASDDAIAARYYAGDVSAARQVTEGIAAGLNATPAQVAVAQAAASAAGRPLYFSDLITAAYSG